MSEITEITYLYRDAGNYKFRSHFAVSGIVRFTDVAPYLIDSCFFIPASIGLKNLTPAIRNDDDHDFHEFEDFIHISGSCQLNSSDFIRKIQFAFTKGWRHEI